MNEEEIFKIWDRSMPKKSSLNIDVEKIAMRKSADLCMKIKKNIIVELIIAIPLCISLPVLFYNDGILFLVSIVITSLALITGSIIYSKYLYDFDKLNQVILLKSIEKKISILKRYVRQLNFYLIVFMPLGFLVGIFLYHGKSEISVHKILKVCLVTFPILLLFIWFGKKYIYQLYGRYLEQLQEIYSQLVE
ncbi:MAG: hypothetical protein ACK5QC_06525 [Bacteroidota bacterium]|jgi:hypothetical protein|nr:hypothetical protein [Bacteroidota bacterium]MCA6442088.1 hypothetical protein [Bacteroidota bacterium]